MTAATATTATTNTGATIAQKPAGWSTDAVEALFQLPFADLMFRAQQVHRQHFDANAIQRSTLLSIKTGGCSEDCGYCSQSARRQDKIGIEREKLLELEEVKVAAKAAKNRGASRFCMGAAWRGPKDGDLDRVIEMVRAVKDLGMETCLTLGLLGSGQAEKLAAAGLDYYNHNLDTGAEFYDQVITTAWVNRAACVPRCWRNWPTSIRRPNRCRSTIWSRLPARRWKMRRRSIPSSSFVPSPPRASPCRPLGCGFPPVGTR